MYSEVQLLISNNISGGRLDYCHPTLCTATLLAAPGRSGCFTHSVEISIYQVTAKENCSDCSVDLAASLSKWLPGEELTPQGEHLQSLQILYEV